MRSGDWRNPFPEELNRRIAAKLVDIHFAPGDRARQPPAREVAGEMVDTGRIRSAMPSTWRGIKSFRRWPCPTSRSGWSPYTDSS